MPGPERVVAPAATAGSARLLFERAVAAGAQLLRVERLPTGGSEDRSPAFLFTFDVGRILVTVENRALRGDHVVALEDVPTGMVDAAEEEPWWRLLGNPLTRVGTENGALALQLRHDRDNPRTVRLEVEGVLVRATLAR